MTATIDELELARLFAAAEEQYARGSSTSDYEPAFIRLLEFIQSHPACHQAAERRFLDGLTTGSPSWELISFCMHSLRMEAVRREATRLIVPENPRGWGALSSIVAAFDDDWEDADLWEYFTPTHESCAAGQVHRLSHVGFCSVCGTGPVGIRLCAAGHAVMLCDECDAVWQEPELTSSPRFPAQPDLPCPVCGGSLRDPPAHWASADEIRALGLESVVKGNGAAL